MCLSTVYSAHSKPASSAANKKENRCTRVGCRILGSRIFKKPNQDPMAFDAVTLDQKEMSKMPLPSFYVSSVYLVSLHIKFWDKKTCLCLYLCVPHPQPVLVFKLTC